MKKPCIYCEKDCDILPVQLGDSFTLTYLRVCSSECMFLIAYEYLYEIFHHKDFRGKLYDLQNEEDKKECDEFIAFTTKQFLDDFGKHLKENPNILSRPIPEGILGMFGDSSKIPPKTSTTMRFTRPSKEERIKWQKDHVERLKSLLDEASKELNDLLVNKLG